MICKAILKNIHIFDADGAVNNCLLEGMTIQNVILFCQSFIMLLMLTICSRLINKIFITNLMTPFLLLLITLFAISHCSYQPPVALEMAYLSAIAYDSVISIDSWNCKLCQQYKINLPKTFLNISSGVKGFTGYSVALSKIVVSFKGADNVNTFINELKTARDSYSKCNGCEVSRSFNELYLTVQATVLANVQSLHRIYRNAGFIITGHGLGGAFAILAAADIQSIYQNADAVYTFGQPRVGNAQFAASYSKNLPETYRVINYGDIVPHLPLSQAGFSHSSFEEWYQNSMQTYTTCEGESTGCSNSLPTSSLNVADNSITAYMNLKTSMASHLQEQQRE